MAIEIVQAISQAEQEAARLEKEASAKAEAIIQQAKEDGKSLITAMTNEVLGKTKQDLEKAELQGKELMITAVQRAEKEIVLLKEIVKSREQAAIDLVLSEVI